MLNLEPFLLFEGNCAEAMAFYQSCLGGDLTVIRLGETPMGQQQPPELHDRVVYASLRSGALELSATDWAHPTRKPRQGNRVGMYLTGNAAEELEAIFARLAVGADPELLDELQDLPFGLYGHLADRYGVHWFFRADPR